MKYIEATVNCKGISGLLTGGEGGRREVICHRSGSPQKGRWLVGC